MLTGSITRVILVFLTLAAGAHAFVTSQPHWLFVSFGVGCIAWAATARRWRVVAFNLGLLSLIVFVGAWLVRPVDLRQEFSIIGGIVTADPELGHRSKQGLHVQVRGLADETLLYEVTYDTDEHGLRIGPAEPLPLSEECILFFGDSFTFGEGVENDEAMPYRVAVSTEGRYRVRNFGVVGYGPHHMLAQIESGFVDEAARCRPRFAIYQSIPHHAARAAGKWDWDSTGPAYELRENGMVERIGRFSDRPEQGSGTASANWSFGARMVTMEDVLLVHGIVKRSRELLAVRFPGIEFHVLDWDIEPPPLFSEGWQDEDIIVHRLSKVLDFDDGNQGDSLLIPYDGHPTAATHRKIAEYVTQAILGLDGRRDG
jgi:hypothetical protein